MWLTRRSEVFNKLEVFEETVDKKIHARLHVITIERVEIACTSKKGQKYNKNKMLFGYFQLIY